MMMAGAFAGCAVGMIGTLAVLLYLVRNMRQERDHALELAQLYRRRIYLLTEMAFLEWMLKTPAPDEASEDEVMGWVPPDPDAWKKSA